MQRTVPNNRFVVDSHSKHKTRLVWPYCAIFLLAINVYLFLFQGLPEKPVDRFASAGYSSFEFHSATNPFSLCFDAIARIVDEFGYSSRFAMERAKRISGQRLMRSWCRKLEGKIKPDDTFVSALQNAGLKSRQVYSLIESLEPILDFRHCRAGDTFEALVAPSGTVQQFSYRKSLTTSYQVHRDNGKLISRRFEKNADVEIAAIGVRIEGSLWQSLVTHAKAGALVMKIVDIFAWDIDFYVDTHPGDSLSLLVERFHVGGSHLRYGRILAALYQGHSLGEHHAFWYQPEKGKAGYYDQQADSLRKAFLKSPLKFARVSSRYGKRVHPILGFDKMHNGVDFAAPIGTPVWAPADGLVVFAGWHRQSGRCIRLRHANGYETFFAHLSRIDRSVRARVRVEQKQIIGKVGNSGRSTGPHLHYGMKLRYRHINPLGLRFPPADPVPDAERQAYFDSIKPLQGKLRQISIPAADRTASASAALRDAG